MICSQNKLRFSEDLEGNNFEEFANFFTEF